MKTPALNLQQFQAEIIALCATEVNKYSNLLQNMVVEAAGAHPINFKISAGEPSYKITTTRGMSTVSADVKFTIAPDIRPSWHTGSADLVYLFNNGYDTNGKMVFKDHHGSLTHRSGSLFINNAVDAFNAATPSNVNATHDGSFFHNA